MTFMFFGNQNRHRLRPIKRTGGVPFPPQGKVVFWHKKGDFSDWVIWGSGKLRCVRFITLEGVRILQFRRNF